MTLVAEPEVIEPTEAPKKALKPKKVPPSKKTPKGLPIWLRT